MRTLNQTNRTNPKSAAMRRRPCLALDCRLRWLLVLGIVLMVTVMASPSAQALDVGDKAPLLSISSWVQGEAVDFRKDIGKKLYLVEFWATWCPPCKMSVPLLTDIQKKYKKDLTIIGITSLDDRGNSKGAIKRFTHERGSEMSYSVAIDRGEETATAYLVAARAPGIPHAFLVGKHGNIVWQGSPLDPDMDSVISDTIAGKYDVEAAKRNARLQAEVSNKIQEVMYFYQLGQPSRAWDAAVGVLKIDPSNMEVMDMLLQMYVNDTRDVKAFRSLVSSHVASFRDNADVMRHLAAVLCTNPDFALRTPDLALEAARAGYHASRKKDPLAAATYAMACYQIGAIDRAIELQKEAIKLAGDEDPSLASTLEYYVRCKQLASGKP